MRQETDVSQEMSPPVAVAPDHDVARYLYEGAPAVTA
jgi:hypothetical protein